MTVMIGGAVFVSAWVFTFLAWRSGFDPAGSLMALAGTAPSSDWGNMSLYSPPGLPFSPLAIASLRIDAVLWPFLPAGYFVLNLLFHCLNCALIHRLVLMYKPRDPLSACIAASFFGISPATLPYIFTIGHRAALMSLSFLLIALLLLRSFDEYGWAGRLVLGWMAFGASLASCSWSILTLPLVLGHGSRKRVGILPHAALFILLAVGYSFVVPAVAWSSTLRPLREWSLLPPILSLVPVPDDIPRQDLRLFLALCWGALYVVGLPCAYRRIGDLGKCLVWFVPGIAAASQVPPDSLGPGLQNLYIFLPGVAIFTSILLSHAFQSHSRQMRFFAGFICLSGATAYLNVCSIYGLRLMYRTGRIDSRLDRVAEMASKRGRPPKAIFVVNFAADSIGYLRDCDTYLDPLYRCRRRSPNIGTHLVGVAEGAVLWTHPAPAFESEVHSRSIGPFMLADVGEAARLSERADAMVLAMEDGRAVEIDIKAVSESAKSHGYRQLEWKEPDLLDWTPNDAALLPGSGTIILQSGPTDPYFFSQRFSWPTMMLSRLRLRMVVLAPGLENQLKFYWESAHAKGFSEQRAIVFSMPRVPVGTGRVLSTVDLDLSKSLLWLESGTVISIRLDPPRGSVLEIESVSLAPPVEATLPGRVSTELVWKPDAGKELRLGNVGSEASPGCFQASTEDPWLSIPVSIDPDDSDALQLTMSCTAPGGNPGEKTEGRVYWSTLAAPIFGEDRSIPFLVRLDSERRTYIIRLDRHFRWLTGGRVTNLRVDPIAGAGEFCIESLEIQRRVQDSMASGPGSQHPN